MLLTRKSLFTQKENTLEIPMDEEEFKLREALWRSGTYIQDAFDGLDPALREFIKTGTLPEEWDDMWADSDIEPPLL